MYGHSRIGSPSGKSATHGAVSVGTTATAIPTTNKKYRKVIAIYNTSKNADDIVYIGNSNVSTSNGYPIPPSSGLPLECNHLLQWYGIVASGSVNVRHLEIDND
jgi:hypothetical protein